LILGIRTGTNSTATCTRSSRPSINPAEAQRSDRRHSQQNTAAGAAAERFPQPDLTAANAKDIEVLPFSTYHTPEQIAAWTEHFSRWLAEGRFVFPHTIVDGGIAQAPRALVSLLAGAYRGNVSVRILAD
jgi:hypothetical protein